MLANYAVNLGRALAASHWQLGLHNECVNMHVCVWVHLGWPKEIGHLSVTVAGLKGATKMVAN